MYELAADYAEVLTAGQSGFPWALMPRTKQTFVGMNGPVPNH